jgi:hypothetical protein
MTAASRKLVQEITKLLPQFIKDLGRLQPEYSSADRIWRLPMRVGDKPKDWVMTHVSHYKETYHFSWTAHRLAFELNSQGKALSATIENLEDTELKRLIWALKHFNGQIQRVKKDWVSVYRETVREYPLAMRYGIVPKAVIWNYYPDTYRVDTELGKRPVHDFIRQVRAYTFHEEYSGHHKSMTLALFMRYCKVAYLANAGRFQGALKPGMSGLEMYKRLADGRDAGLTELPANSADAFTKWYGSARGGSHPWEVYRGGNTTHISLGITERRKGWSVFLGGSSTTRMAETIRIALALVKAGLSIEIYDAQHLMLRLLGMDNVGLIPEYTSNHRAAQDFEGADEVFDCVHLDELPRYNRILPFITWKPVALMRPVAV